MELDALTHSLTLSLKLRARSLARYPTTFLGELRGIENIKKVKAAGALEKKSGNKQVVGGGGEEDGGGEWKIVARRGGGGAR